MTDISILHIQKLRHCISTGKISNLLQSFTRFKIMGVLLRPHCANFRPRFQDVSLTKFEVYV